jgi:mersacidin/lichenicidin family type 2 lantibiotic
VLPIEEGEAMSVTEIVRAWIDEDTREQLTQAQLDALPEHPAGSIDAELDQLMGEFDLASRAECPITSFSRNPCCA